MNTSFDRKCWKAVSTKLHRLIGSVICFVMAFMYGSSTGSAAVAIDSNTIALILGYFVVGLFVGAIAGAMYQCIRDTKHSG